MCSDTVQTIFFYDVDIYIKVLVGLNVFLVLQALLSFYCTECSWVAKPSNRSEFEFGVEQIKVVLSQGKGNGWMILPIYPSSVVSVSVSLYISMSLYVHT